MASVCIQDLRAYNQGTLYYHWYDVEKWDFEDAFSDFRERCKEDLGYEPEELMIADYSDFPNLGEYPDLNEMEEIWKVLQEGRIPAEAVKIYVEAGYPISDIEDAYEGEYESMVDFAYELVDSCYNLEEMMGHLSAYFDYEAFARDLIIGGDYWFSDGYVFRNI